jgi:predicted small integral membrane protein
MMQSLAWMAWTLPTAIFFAAIACALAVMTWLAVRYPEMERVGILGIVTTRGDRLFISLVGSAVIHLIWIGLFDTHALATLPIGEGVEVSSLWGATLLSLGYAFAVFRKV